MTGGVYKTREHIHRGVADPRLLAIPTSRRRIAAFDPNWDRLFGICSTSRSCFPLCRPLWYVCSPGRKGHDDLTSSPPSSVLTTAVSLESPAELLATKDKGFARYGTLPNTSRHELTTAMQHLCKFHPEGSLIPFRGRHPSMSSPGKVLRVDRIKPHTPPLVRVPVNSFEF